MDLHPVILRFNFTEDIIAMINDFSRVYQYVDRHTYKEHWNTWFEENNLLLSSEIKRLENHGYKGNVKDKMYKAGRYYFRKKTIIVVNDEETNTNAKAKAKPHDDNIPRVKRMYIVMDKTFIEEIDKHIIASMRTHQSHGVRYTPAFGFKEFCKLHDIIFNQERNRLLMENNLDHKLVDNKIKKTYKNRYFIITR
jgi:hypothetical protein